jgi:hypothetical protein
MAATLMNWFMGWFLTETTGAVALTVFAVCVAVVLALTPVVIIGEIVKAWRAALRVPSRIRALGPQRRVNEKKTLQPHGRLEGDESVGELGKSKG